jgi:hypothetical protein
MTTRAVATHATRLAERERLDAHNKLAALLLVEPPVERPAGRERERELGVTRRTATARGGGAQERVPRQPRLARELGAEHCPST